jgi:signal transduction histidine kinase
MRNKLSILILEDNIPDAELIKRFLTDSGVDFNSKIVSDKKEYIAAVEQDAFDIILSDHRLPQFSSNEALKLVLDKNLDVAFILVTGTVSEEFAVSILQQGADDYILKTNLQRLPTAISNAIEKHVSRRAQKDFEEKILKSEKELKESQVLLRQLTGHLQRIREEERTTIAREIHDELGGQLTVLKMDLAWLNKRAADSNVKERIASMLSLIDQTVKTVRRISSQLRPGILDDLGLVAALDWQSHEFEKHTGIHSKFLAEISDDRFEKSLASGIFRVFQETLTNVARHSGAKEVQSSLKINDGNIVLTIADNGKGFNESMIKEKNTLGIVGMKERALMMGGSLKIESGKNEGTQIVLNVPLKTEPV